MKTLVLLDAHALIHRAYHALPKFISKNTGEPTGALYGLSTMLLKAVRELKPDYIVAAFDRPEPTFRHETYEAYKAKRPEAEEDLVKQLIRARDIVEAFGIPILDSAGFEADDILGTIVEQVKKNKDLKIIIVSGDMDVLQLVDGDRVVVYTLRRGMEDTIIYNEEKVKERYGFGPKLVPDFKGLKGDPSDNIVGVKGIGEKTATDIIKNFGNLENLYEWLGKGVFTKPLLKERVIKLLLENKKDAFFSKTLATIRRDAPIKFEIPETKFQINKEKITKIFSEIGFTSLISRINGGATISPETAEAKTDKKKEKLGMKPENAVFLTGDEEEWFKILPDKLVVSADIKALIKFLKKRGLPEPKNFFDLTVASWVAESRKKVLDDLKPEELPALYGELLELTRARGLLRVLYEIEFPLIPILAEMEMNGIGVDGDFLEKFKKEISGKLADLQAKIYKIAGREFNINSPAQVSEIIFGPPVGGRKSTRESELLKFKDKFPVIPFILDYRELAKLLTTYINPLILFSRKEPRVHTTFNQIGTVTGRLSSDSPNLQNIPVRTELGARIRDAFVASAEHTFAAFDYSQIELKILASLAEDKKMIDAFKKGLDIHRFTAANINNISMDKVTTQMRYGAKTINFGIVYGMGVRRLAQSTGMNLAEAKKFYDEYFHDFPEIRSYMDRIKQNAKATGYVETLFGRKRFFDVKNIRGNRFLESEMERMALNAVIQGTDADIVKLAMVAVHKKIDSPKIRLILQIHDELLYEIADDIIKEAIPQIRAIMEGICALQAPLSVDIKTGKRWGSLKVYDI